MLAGADPNRSASLQPYKPTSAVQSRYDLQVLGPNVGIILTYSDGPNKTLKPLNPKP